MNHLWYTEKSIFRIFHYFFSEFIMYLAKILGFTKVNIEFLGDWFMQTSSIHPKYVISAMKLRFWLALLSPKMGYQSCCFWLSATVSWIQPLDTTMDLWVR